ncbi:MAG: protein SCO1/2 [Alphaproteobacteria bacterium]|jgi:protein SCO1/2
MLNIKNKALGGLFVLTLLLITISVAIISTLPVKPPLINGILIPEAIVLDEFTVIDHNNAPFTNRELEGKWHLLSYGFTNCPDICPTILSVLSEVSNNLNQQQEYSDLDILFYSIDHERDTTAQLASYLAYFNENFIGLTYVDGMVDTAMPFEKSLGMVSILKPVQSEKSNNSGENEVFESYTVSHGFTLYLINPSGDLQAVFRPEENKDGSFHFTKEQILVDYLAIRNYLG